MRLVYLYITELEDGITFEDTLDGHTTDLFYYLVPESAADGFTNTVSFTVTSKSAYNAVEMYLSLSKILLLINL